MKKAPNTPSRIMLLSIQMLADVFDEMYLDFTLQAGDDVPHLRGYQIFSGQEKPREDVLYIIPEGLENFFDVDRFSYITSSPLKGSAPHISNLQLSLPRIVNEVADIFQSYADFELQLNRVLADGGTLTDLCRVGSDFFHNPIYIHDDLFSVLALSSRVEGMLKFERSEKSGNLYIPLALINDFKFDPNYGKTMELHHAGLWDNEQYPYTIRSLFFNLWDGDKYCGRLLINELQSSLLPSQSQTIEYLGQYALMLMRHRTNANSVFQNFEDTFIGLLNGADVDRRDLRTVLSILDWHESDRYLCLKFENQDPKISIRSDSALSGKLSSVLSDFSSFYYQNRLCTIINLSRSKTSDTVVQRSLAPYVRDSYMYVGISNPTESILDISYAFRQADIVLDYITRENSSQWILPFRACALSYVCGCATREFPPKAFVSPMLTELIQYDRQNGTQYYETLLAYLIAERNIPKTAEALIIHRTTLTYRLKKISELIKVNLDDPNQRQYLLLSFFILEHERQQESSDPSAVK